MVFQVPPSKASSKQNRFEFQVVADGPVYSIPLLKYVKNGLKARLSQLTEENLKFSDLLMIFEADPAARTAVDEIEQEQTDELLKAYHEASGITLPESSPSKS
ncbi:hypothetical protein RCH12_002774 [Cryobacterium sp. MP_3.1]|uniref:hypothetical protein n=1 Tax=Cryobacterium sp. MP_3.1 TaxID=3071711 RepID=UPI002DFDF7FD|nr:hypothetical protein [Cryobacterium sp. MP_3.1]